MNKFAFTLGWHEIRDNVWAYLQPDGSWGWNNAGMVASQDKILLIDTLFDLPLTQLMLNTMPGGPEVDMLAITHANGDHVFGNELVADAEIIATKLCAAQMAETPPAMLAELLRAAPDMGDLGVYFSKCFGNFTFDGITLTMPTRTFENELELVVGQKQVLLKDAGPAHTKSDVMVYIPSSATAFAGDLLFIGGTPIMWEGPIANWVNACDLLLSWDVENIVPGHGPIVGKKEVTQFKQYLLDMAGLAKKYYDAGFPEKQAVAQILETGFSKLPESERMVINVNSLYREFAQDPNSPNIVDLFAGMAQVAKSR